MGRKTKKCIHCRTEFTCTHGNQTYCPGKDCSYIAKLERQEGNYQIGNAAKAAMRKNYFLFVRFAGNQKKTELDFKKLQNLGFDQFGFYKFKWIDKICHYYINDYSFSLTDNIITIWKH